MCFFIGLWRKGFGVCVWGRGLNPSGVLLQVWLVHIWMIVQTYVLKLAVILYTCHFLFGLLLLIMFFFFLNKLVYISLSNCQFKFSLECSCVVFTYLAQNFIFHGALMDIWELGKIFFLSWKIKLTQLGEILHNLFTASLSEISWFNYCFTCAAVNIGVHWW